MTFPRARAVVAGFLLIAWLGFLLYLVVISRQTIVLSRPQLMAASFVVVAEVADDDGKPAKKVQVLDDLWHNQVADLKLVGKELIVDNLPDAAKQGYTGPGKYILPLERVTVDPKGLPFTRVRQVPANPGFEPAFVKVQLWSAGKDPDHAAALAAEYLQVDEKAAREKLAKLVAREMPAAMLARGVPRGDAIEFIRKLHELDPAAEAGLLGDDIRIYPLTPQTQAQIDELRR